MPFLFDAEAGILPRLSPCSVWAPPPHAFGTSSGVRILHGSQAVGFLASLLAVLVAVYSEISSNGIRSSPRKARLGMGGRAK